VDHEIPKGDERLKKDCNNCGIGRHIARCMLQKKDLEAMKGTLKYCLHCRYTDKKPNWRPAEDENKRF
jgi:hypothetical protein